MEDYSIGDLAAAAGVTPRAVRFYVQRKLLPAPLGVGRGNHYDRSHLDRLRQIADLQSAGHSLDAIGHILAGRRADPPTDRPAPAARLTAELWTRVTLVDGVELHYDTARHQPDAESLLLFRKFARKLFLPELEE